MYKPKYGSVSFEKLSECGSKTGISLTGSCECGKTTIKVQSLRLMLKLNGLREIVEKREIGNDRNE
jgi:hypothetical protein